MSFGMASPPVPLVEKVKAAVADSAEQMDERPPARTWEEARARRRARLHATLSGTHACGGLVD